MTYNQPPSYTPPPQASYAPQGGQRPMDGGYLYPNDKKLRAEQPDQKGKIRLGDEIIRRIMAGEREFYISGWYKQDPKRPGANFLSVKMKGIDPKPTYAAQYGGPTAPPSVPQGWGNPPPSAPAQTGQWGPAQPATASPQYHGHGHSGGGHAGVAGGQRPTNGPSQPQTQVNWAGGGDDIPF